MFIGTIEWGPIVIKSEYDEGISWISRKYWNFDNLIMNFLSGFSMNCGNIFKLFSYLQGYKTTCKYLQQNVEKKPDKNKYHLKLTIIE